MKYTNFEYRLIKDVGATINKFSLIKENDSVAVAVSGGKDSYALLEILNLRLNHIPIKYKLIAVHVDFTDNDEQIQNIKKFCSDRNIECIIKKERLVYENIDEVNCFWCAWNRRKILFDLMRDMKISKLAFGHNLNDTVETLFLNMFFQSKFESFYPKTSFFRGSLDVVRPLIEIKDERLKKYAKEKKFPTQIHKCPFGIESERIYIRNILNSLDDKNKKILTNTFSAWIKNVDIL